MDKLLPGQSLPVDGSLTSPNGKTTLVFQGDGNLVLYRAGGVARWASDTAGRAVDVLEMQGDGNLVMYGPGHSYVWDSATDGHYGAWLILQDDGNLVIYDANNQPLWSTDTWIRQHSVPGFLPSRNAFHFSNSSFPDCPLFSVHPPIPYGNISIPVGNASNGVCGGMVFTVRDLFESNMLPPATTVSPCGGDMYNYLVDRFISSFNLPGGIATYLFLMNPALPDHETEMSKLGLAPRGRAWRMIVNEWPVIKRKLDNNQLVPLGLVQTKSLNPMDLGENHVVLVYGYELDGADLTLKIYDPNFPDADDVTFRMSIADPNHTTQVFRSHGQKPVWCFFQPGYSYKRPDFVFADGSMVRERSRPEVFVIFGNGKFWVPSPQVVDELYGGWGNVREVPDGKLGNIGSIPVNGTILKEQHDPMVYIIDQNKKRHVTSPAVLERVGGWQAVRTVPAGGLLSIPTGAPLN